MKDVVVRGCLSFWWDQLNIKDPGYGTQSQGEHGNENHQTDERQEPDIFNQLLGDHQSLTLRARRQSSLTLFTSLVKEEEDANSQH